MRKPLEFDLNRSPDAANLSSVKPVKEKKAALKLLSARLNVADIQRLKHLSINRNETVQDLMGQALREFLDRNNA